MRSIYLYGDKFYDAGGGEVNHEDFLVNPARDHGGMIAIGQRRLSKKQLAFLVSVDSACHVRPYRSGTLMHGPVTKLNYKGRGLYHFLDKVKVYLGDANRGLSVSYSWHLHPAAGVFNMLHAQGGSQWAICEMISHLGDMRQSLGTAVRSSEQGVSLVRAVVEDYTANNDDAVDFYAQARAALIKAKNRSDYFWLAAIFGDDVPTALNTGGGPFIRFAEESQPTGNALAKVGSRVLEMIVSAWLGSVVHSEYFVVECFDLSPAVSVRKEFLNATKSS